MAAYGLYTHIAANRSRSVMMLIALLVQVYVMVFAGALFAEVMIHGNAALGYLLRAAWGDFLRALPFATLGAALWGLIAYRYHQRMIDAVTGGRAVSRRDEPRLYNLLENLCISRGIPMPQLKVMESPALNAFATGLNAKQYSITVTTGLLRHLNDAEVEAVLGHELTHIRNGDVRLMVIAVVIAGVIGFFAEMFFRIFFNSNLGYDGVRAPASSSSSSEGGNKGSGGAFFAILIAVALIGMSWVLSLLIRFGLSRSREYLADAGSVELTKNPDAMISALRKIENRGELEGSTSAVMEMCVDNPREGFVDLFATHPSIDRRVAALMVYAGGHDPGPLAVIDATSVTETPDPGPTPPPAAAALTSPPPTNWPWGRPAPVWPTPRPPGSSPIGMPFAGRRASARPWGAITPSPGSPAPPTAEGIPPSGPWNHPRASTSRRNS